MEANNLKKTQQIGMDFGKASAILKKSIMFEMAHRLGMSTCHQCGLPIDSVDEFSIEHKIPYLDSDNPPELFFSLDNIAFSHLKCNVSARRKRKSPHGTYNSYAKGCKCGLCTQANRDKKNKYYANKKRK